MFLVFSGKKGAGKDTIAAEIMKKPSYFTFKRVGLADYLKEICIKLYGLDEKVCYSLNKDVPTKYIWRNMPWYRWWKYWTKRNKLVTHREFLQYFGSEICRSIDDSCWVNYIIRTCTDKNIIYVITDCRFPSELEPFQRAGAIIIRLTRNPYNDKHQSENALNNHKWGNFEKVDNSIMGIYETVKMTKHNIEEQLASKNMVRWFK